jgi:Brp/Blh family beta-carotene 15,15'-monooxygenase
MGVNSREDATWSGSDASATERAQQFETVVGRPVRLLFLALTGVGALVAATGLSLPTWARYLPLALTVVLFGLPHGAIDHFVPARLGAAVPIDSARRSAVAVGLLYLLLGGGYALVWLAAPRLAALSFVGLTWFHWGQGDVWTLRRVFGADHLRARWLRAATLAVRGGLPMLVPLLAFPERYRAVLSAWVALFAAPLDLPWLFAPRTRLALGAGFAIYCVGTLGAGRLAVDGPGGRQGWRVDAAEVGLLWAFFLLVPPLVAVGLYFACWHALRHVARLVLLAPDREPPRESVAFAMWLWGAVRRFAREAAPLTALSLVLLGGFGTVVPATVENLPEYAALYLVFVAVVTLPHVVVVTLMDHAEGVWTDDRPSDGG